MQGVSAGVRSRLGDGRGALAVSGSLQRDTHRRLVVIGTTFHRVWTLPDRLLFPRARVAPRRLCRFVQQTPERFQRFSMVCNRFAD